MSAKSKKPTLDYFPVTPCVDACDNGGNGMVIAASIILVILLLAIVIGGVVYCFNGSEGGCFGEGHEADTKYVGEKAADAKHHHKKELMECPEDLARDLLSGKMKGPVVLAFVAPWCGHCNTMKPALHEAAKEAATPIYTLTHEKGKTYMEDLMKALKVGGFPMLFKLHDGNATPYKGNRSKISILEFAS